MAQRYCTNCGHELGDEARFCGSCGQPVHETAQISTPEADVNVPPPPMGRQAQGGAGQPGESPPGGSEAGWRQRHPTLTAWLVIAGVVFVLVIIGAAVSGGNETAGGDGGQQAQESGQEQEAQQQPNEEQQAQEQAGAEQQVQEQADEGQQGRQQQQAQAERNPRPEPQYTVGETARVGNVEWTITDAYRTTQLRSNFGTQKRGNFVVVDFTFTNNRSEEVTLDPQLHMILRDSRGREFGTDPDAWEFVPPRLDIFLQPVNPGISQNGRVIYQVPPDTGGFVLTVDDVEFLEDQTARYDLGNLPTR